LLIVNEAQGGYRVNMQELEQHRVQPSRLFIQGCGSHFGLCSQYGEIDFGMRIIDGQIDAGQCNHPDTIHVELALYQDGQILLDLIRQLDNARWIRFGFMSTHNYSVRAISLISKISS